MFCQVVARQPTRIPRIGRLTRRALLQDATRRNDVLVQRPQQIVRVVEIGAQCQLRFGMEIHTRTERVHRASVAAIRKIGGEIRPVEVRAKTSVQWQIAARPERIRASIVVQIL